MLEGFRCVSVEFLFSDVIEAAEVVNGVLQCAFKAANRELRGPAEMFYGVAMPATHLDPL